MSASTIARQLVQAEADLAARERALAAALEQLNLDAAVRASYWAGADAERQRVLQLIDIQLEQLSRCGLNALSLRTLRSSVAS